MAAELRAQLSLNTDLLGHLERESQHLRQPEAAAPSASLEARRELLPRLDEAVRRNRRHREYWLTLGPEIRTSRTEIRDLLRQNQDLIMLLIVLDRENEQLLLRREGRTVGTRRFPVAGVPAGLNPVCPVLPGS